jgi:hypothetical protein
MHGTYIHTYIHRKKLAVYIIYMPACLFLVHFVLREMTF